MTHEISLIVTLARLRKTDHLPDIQNYDVTDVYNLNKVQRRFKGDAAPGKSKVRSGKDIAPLFYPFSFPEQPRKQQ